MLQANFSGSIYICAYNQGFKLVLSLLIVFYYYNIVRMFSTLRKFLVILLTMLQFIVPLVHAHSSDYRLKQGLHVPGLEQYDAEHNTPIDQMKTLQYNFSVDCMIVGVNIGLEQNQTNPRTDSDNNYYLHQQTVAFNSPVSKFDTNFSPQPQQLVYQLFSPSRSPRAPPVQ